MAASLCLSIRISNKLITFFLTLSPSGTVVSGRGAGWASGGFWRGSHVRWGLEFLAHFLKGLGRM